MQPQRCVMLGISLDSYNVVVWVMSQFCDPLNNKWLDRKLQSTIPNNFESLVIEIRKMSMLPNIRDDGTDSLIGLTQGVLRYVAVSLVELNASTNQF
jgi:hypothetical protein